MLLKPHALKLITTGIVAPHGMTDWIHALQTKNVPMLLKINAATASSFFIMNKTGNEYLLNIFFLLFSIMHFKHDIPFKYPFLKFFTVEIILLLSVFNLDILYFYLTFIHVPNHYKLNWKYLSKTPIKSFLLMSVSTFFMVNFEKFNLNNVDFIQPIYFDLLKSIIVSHIIYQELFIHTSISRYLMKILMYNLDF
jgi:hypothetical protein